MNSGHGGLEALATAEPQAASSFLSTGVTARIVQHFSPIKNRFVSYFFCSLIPSSLTFVFSYVAHRLNQTPELLGSCVAPTFINYTTSLAIQQVLQQIT